MILEVVKMNFCANRFFLDYIFLVHGSNSIHSLHCEGRHYDLKSYSVEYSLDLECHSIHCLEAPHGFSCISAIISRHFDELELDDAVFPLLLG